MLMHKLQGMDKLARKVNILAASMLIEAQSNRKEFAPPREQILSFLEKTCFKMRLSQRKENRKQ